ncbi:papilin [Nephila pilipes]|uniref:Papilin n=1 Tax=Nephila pilipes TaxID=299642 RepID=A0A8X6U535_NEPPI|nr:papilin [Nephila pilipes]
MAMLSSLWFLVLSLMGSNIVQKDSEVKAFVSTRISLATEYPTVGEPLQIDCYVRGPSGVQVTWYKDDQTLNSNNHIKIMSNHTVFIAKAQVEDSGNYKCSAKYGNSQSSSSIYVTVGNQNTIVLSSNSTLCPDQEACDDFCYRFPLMILNGRCNENDCECY